MSTTEAPPVTPTVILVIRGGRDGIVHVDDRGSYQIWTVPDDLKIELINEEDMRGLGWVPA